MSKRIAIGGIWHETNTFAADLTTLEDFRNYQFAVDEEVLDKYTDTRTELGGMLAAGPKYSFEYTPTIYAAAVPSGTIQAGTLSFICDEMVARLTDSMPLDGMLVSLHGAAVAESIDDADACVLDRIRSVLGPDVPVVGTFDFHANLGQTMVAGADVLVGYDTFPHVDMADRGHEAARILAGLLDGSYQPKHALRKIPVLTVPQNQSTDEAPVKAIMERLHRIESHDGILCGSVAMGFPYADVPQLGASVLVYADDEARANAAADELAASIWDRRAAFEPNLVPVDTGIAQAVASSETPVILVEPADNVGGGSAGDGAYVLDALLRAGAEGAVIVIADPEAVSIADALGEGAVFDAPVGGKVDAMHGSPVRLQGKVQLLTDGRYRHTSSYMTGYITSMGRTAVIAASNIQVVLTTLRTMPFDTEQLRCVGIIPEQQRIIVIKSASAWRAAYGAIAKRVIVVDTPGICASNLAHLDYERRPRPIYPLEPETTFEA